MHFFAWSLVTYSIACQVESTPTAANVGFNSWSHDIGGFDCCGGEQGGGYGKCPFPAWPGCETNSSTRNGSQLLVRWLQHGALSAVDRTHCGGCNRLFWTFPNFGAMKDAMLLRNALFPYIYTANHATRTTGVSLVHPTYYEAPAADQAYKFVGQYMFGDAMLVAPIVAPTALDTNTFVQNVWLPPGSWVTWDGMKTHASPAPSGLEVTEAYGVDGVPIYVRAGSVVPLRNFDSLTQTTAFSDPLIWAVWPDEIPGGGNATVVEDDGVTLRFDTHDARATTHMSWVAEDGNILHLSVGSTTGSFDVGCESESGFEYAGPGADLQDLGPVSSAQDCCSSCSLYSNCGFWTFDTQTHHCTLKISRSGRRVNPNAVSGVAPRRMPTHRAHGFQIRSKRTSQKPVSVTANGVALREVAPGDKGEAGWFVQPTAGAGLTVSANALVVLTPGMTIQQTLEVIVHW